MPKDPAKLLQFVEIDRYIVIALILLGSALVSYLTWLPEVWANQFDYSFFEPVFLSLLIALLCRAAMLAPEKHMRSFWWLVAAGFAAWLSTRAIHLALPDSPLTNNELFEDTLFLLHSSAIALAIELRFDMYAERLWLQRRIVYVAGALLLVFSSFVYFAIIPLASGDNLYTSPFMLYAVIDFYLACRFLYASTQARNRSWATLYLCFGVVFCLIVLADSYSWLVRDNLVEYQPGDWSNFAWYIWYPFAMLATGIKLKTSDDNKSTDWSFRSNPAINGLLVYGLTMPLIHVTGYGIGRLDAEVRQVRDLFISGWIMLIGGLLFGLYLLIRRSTNKMEREKNEAMRTANRYERQLERELRTRSLGRLSAGMAHDFGNTVLAISSHSKAIEIRTKNSAPITSELDGLRRSIQFAQDMVGKLSELGGSRDSVALKSLDLNTEVDNAIQVLRPSVGDEITLQFHPAELPVMVAVERSMVHRVVTNYVYNAIDSIESAGVVEVIVEPAASAARCATCGEKVTGAFATLTVSDSGPGIDESIATDIFEPLVSSKPIGAGSGLGLSTVDNMMHRIGGHVRFVSEPDVQTIFFAYFPANSEL